MSSIATVNVGSRLSQTARQRGEAVGVVMPSKRRGGQRYEQVDFAQLERDSNSLAAGLVRLGAKKGDRIALLVKPSIDFISLVFAMLKAGLVIVLIDPGMGRRNLIRCLQEARPKGFVAMPLVHAVRTIVRRRFPESHIHVTAGRRWFWGGATLEELRQAGDGAFTAAETTADDPAAIIFTTGSTGPPKGVLYRHGNFDQQIVQIQRQYGIEPGEIDLPGFPLFGLFNAAMGVTTVIPDMDFTRPAQVQPEKIAQAAKDWSVTQSFGSPALWNRVGRWCQERGETIPTLKRVLSAGAPVPPHVLRQIKAAIHPEGEVHTPYGATEALPVATISAAEVLGDTAAQSEQGAGTCVGRRFEGIQWKVIRIDDGPLETMGDAVELPFGEVGEMIVRGLVVTEEYVTRTEANALHKIRDVDGFWHRMGDVGRLDDQDRFWFYGRKAHRVTTTQGVMFTIPCEAIFNTHQAIYRSALVGVGEAPAQRPVVVAEPWPDRWPKSSQDRQRLIEELLSIAQANELTSNVRDVLLKRSLPVDIRHNAKIFREKLAVWASDRLADRR